MAYCTNCGAETEGKFCRKCGAPVTGTGGEAPPAAMATGGIPENVASALCYLIAIVTGVLFLLLEPYNRNRTIRFHAFQAIFFSLAYIALSLLLGVFLTVFAFMGGFFVNFLYRMFFLAFVIVWLVLMYRAYQNQKWVLPVIGRLAENMSLKN